MNKPVDFSRTHPWPDKYAIGMLHLPPLPGSPDHTESLNGIESHVLRDLACLVDAGFDAVMIENFGDVPFFPGRVPEITVASMTRIAAAVRREWTGPLGINVLRNDGLSALAIALAVNANFIRVNVLTSARLTDQGIVSGIAADLCRARTHWRAGNIGIWADVNVKHSAAIATQSLEDETADLIARGGADVVIVSGRATGDETPLNELATVRSVAGQTPVVVGSGVSTENLDNQIKHCSGVIVGTSLKAGSQIRTPIVAEKAQQFMSRWRESASR